MRVLLVGGDSGVLGSVKRFLEEEDPDTRVVSVQGPEEALRLVSSELFDCVVSDHQTPGVDGVELARRIRETSTVPIILYTESVGEMVDEAFEAGVDSVALKAADPKHLHIIANRIRLVAERRQSEDLYRGVVEQIRDPMRILVGTTVIHANQAMAELLGVDGPDELMGQESTEWIVEEDRERVRETALGRQRGEAQPQLYEFTIQRRDGERRRVEASASLVSYMGRPASLSFVRDITERRQMEEELRESEAKYRGLLESSQDAVFVIAEGRLAYVNQRCVELLGYESAEDLLDSDPLESVAPGDRGLATRMIRDRPRGEEFPVLYQINLLRKDGTVVEVENLVSLIEYEGKPAALVFSRDITERKLMEEEVRELQEYLQLQVDRMPIALIVWDTEFRVKTWNPAATKIFGFSEEEALGRHPYGLIVPRDAQPHVEEVWGRLLEGDETAHSENENTTKDGRTIICDWTNTPLKSSDGTVIGVLSMTQDITERRRLEEEMRLSEERFRGIAERSFDAIVTVGTERKFTFASPAVERIIGYTPEEFTGRTFQDFLPESELPKVMEAFKNMQTGAYTEGLQLRMLRKDGTPAFIEVNGAPIIVDGKVVGMQGCFRDITERRQMEEELRESEERYRTLVEQAPDAILTLNTTGVITSVNDASLRSIGYERDEIVGKHLSRLGAIKPSDLPGYLKIFAQLLKEGSTEPFEVQFHHKDGSLLWGEVSASVLYVGGRRSGLQVIWRNTTERRRMEGELKKTMEDLKRSNKDLESFAYIAAHDLQEPLRLVASYVQLLEKRYKGRLDQDADEYIDYAINGTKRLQNMINGLLALSRVGTRGQPFKPTDFEAVLGRVLTNLQVKMEEEEAVVTHGPLPTIRADASQMESLFQNLIENAVKFRGEPPPRIHITATQERGGWRLSVRDNGIGIEPKHQKQIFDVFRPVHGRKYPGTGIGLSICKKIVERHGGRIWVESQPGEGSTFIFTISTVEGEGRGP